MYETYRMLAHEHELDLEREAQKRSLAGRARGVDGSGGMRQRRRKNLARALILGFAAAAIIASGVQARASDSKSASLRPDDRSGIRGVEPTMVTPDLSEIQRHLRPDEIASQPFASRADDRAGLRAPGIVRSRELATVKGGGFDWADASIGGAAALGFLLLAAGATTLAVRGRRKKLIITTSLVVALTTLGVTSSAIADPNNATPSSPGACNMLHASANGMTGMMNDTHVSDIMMPLVEASVNAGCGHS